MMKKCLVIGASMLDIILQIDKLPCTGEDVYAKSQTMTVGGCAYNVADIIGHFRGAYELFSPIGTGMYANLIEEKLKENGHRSIIKSDYMDNGYCLCMVEENGERTFLTLPGIECQFEKEWFEILDINEFDSVYVSGYEIEGPGGNAILEFLEAHRGLNVYYAPGPRITYIPTEISKRLYRLSPILHLNEKEVLEITGAESVKGAAEQLYSETNNAIITTMGEKGAYLCNGEENTLVPSVQAEVADTIGAGDSHIGTIIAARQQGASFVQAIHLANRVSAMVVASEGSTLTREQFEKGNITNE